MIDLHGKSKTVFNDSGITVSHDGKHVYARWHPAAENGSKGICTVIGLHPASADEHAADPTFDACQNFATNAGYHTIVVVNLFSTPGLDTADVRKCPNPIGPENDLWILGAAKASDIVIVGWGDFPWIRMRARQVQKILGAYDLYAVQVNANGTPTHPKAWKRKAAKLYRKGRPDTLPVAG